MKVEYISVEWSNAFDLHKAIIGLENQFVVFLRVAVLHRFYLTLFQIFEGLPPSSGFKWTFLHLNMASSVKQLTKDVLKFIRDIEHCQSQLHVWRN